MLTILIGGLFLFVLYITASNGEWGPFVLCLVILLALIGMAAGERKDVRAWRNCRDYWADGGPDRRRRH